MCIYCSCHSVFGMVFTPILICRFFFVTYHYCYLCPLPQGLLLLLPATSAISCSVHFIHFLSLSLISLTSMATPTLRSSSVPSLPPPSPKSPPEYPDLYGKRRETARVHMLEREITFLEVGFSVFFFFFSNSLLPRSPCLTSSFGF